MEGDIDVIWGLLDDMWHVFGAKRPLITHRRADSSLSASPAPHQPGRLASPPEPSPPPAHPVQASRSAALGESYDTGSVSRQNQALPSRRSSRGSAASYSQLHSRSPIGQSRRSGLRQQLVSSTPGGRNLLGQSSDTICSRTANDSRWSVNVSQFSAVRSPIPARSSKRRMMSPKMSAFPHISRENERLTREWLKLLNFTTTSAQENDALLKSPFRNGVLLCDVTACSISR